MALDPDALDALLRRARRDVDDGLLPSCSLALGLDGEIVEQHTFGDATDASRYVIYSCTKALVASAVWQVLAEGGFRLDDQVGDLIPEFAPNGKDVVTVEQVLLHTAGFPTAPLGAPLFADRPGRLERFSQWRLNWAPGTRYEYHATSAHWVLAELLERADGADFRTVVRQRVLEPLGLGRLALGVAPDEQHDIRAVAHVGEAASPDEIEAVFGVRVLDVGEVTEEAIVRFNLPHVLAAGVPGGGAVSDAADLARFYQALLHDPLGLWPPEWLAAGTAEVRNRFPTPVTGVPANRALGLVIAGDDGRAGDRGFGRTNGARAFGHPGAGGQVAWADPDSGLSFVYLTNGHDRHVLRQARRAIALSSLAARCAS